jgi:hypothetical protein
VKISVDRTESYGKEYVRIYFNVELNEAFRELPIEQRLLINNYFSNTSSRSGHEFVSCLIDSYTQQRNGKFGYSNKLREYKEVFDCYKILCSFLVKFLETRIGSHIKIKIENMEWHPQFLYVQKLWEDTNF